MTDTPRHPLAQIARECGITVADVRKTLIADSYEYHDRATRLIADTRAHGELDGSGRDTLDAHSAATSYAYLLAALLRIVEDRHGEDEALGMACMVDAVRESGTDVLEDANHDIDERARADGPAPEDVEAKSPACPEIDVTLGAPVQIYYEFPDPLTGRTSGRRVPCTIVKIDGDWFRARPDRLGRGSIGNEFRFRIDTFEADDFNYGWHVEAVDAR